jgi:DNA-binding CsgD family transcriptional regulator
MTPYDVCHMLVGTVGGSVDLTGVMQAVGALRKARDSEVFVLLHPGVADGLQRVLPADQISFTDRDRRARYSVTLELLPIQSEEHHSEFWEHFWDTLTCSYTERIGRLRGEVLVTEDSYGARQWLSTDMDADCRCPGGVAKSLIMPLPAPPGIARRLVFFRRSGGPFGEEHRSAAVLLQPHIADALRLQSRRAATRPLTARQRQLLWLVATGEANTVIARRVGLSPSTVRKHLENAFARLEVSSRTEAVAKICPDATWR